MADVMKTLDQPMAAVLGPDEHLLGGRKSAGENAVLKTTFGGLAGAALPRAARPAGSAMWRRRG